MYPVLCVLISKTCSCLLVARPASSQAQLSSRPSKSVNELHAQSIADMACFTCCRRGVLGDGRPLGFAKEEEAAASAAAEGGASDSSFSRPSPFASFRWGE